MAHLDQTTGDSSRMVTLVDNRLERTMAPLDQTSVDSSQAATLVDSSQAATLVDSSKEATSVDNNREARVSPSLAPKEATDSQPRECSQARTMEPQTLEHRISQLPLILS